MALIIGWPLTASATETDAGAAVTGRAVGPNGGNVAGVNVTLYQVDDQTLTQAGTSVTDSSGSFEFTEIEPGSYTIRLTPPDSSGLLVTWFGGAATSDTSKSFTLAGGQQLVGQDVRLMAGAVITGRVSGPDGAPLVGHRVNANRDLGYTWETAATAITDSDGHYRLSGVEPGSVTIGFSGGDAGEFNREFWRDKPDEGTADFFDVRPGDVFSGMDAQLSGRNLQLPAPKLSTYSPTVGYPVTVTPAAAPTGVRFTYQWFVYNDPIPGATSRSFTPRKTDFGKDLKVRVFTTSSAYSPSAWESHQFGPVRSITRIAGGDRYGTAVAISRSHFQPGVPVLYIASGTNFADALAGGPAAVKDRAPILLTQSTAVPSNVLEEVRRLRPQKVIILGGTGAVSDSVVSRLRSATSAPITRLAGTDRYRTAVAISRSKYPAGAPVVFLASGMNFPDALAASPIAGAQGAPMLLTTYSSIHPAVLAEIKRLKPKRVVVIGAALDGTLGYEVDALAPEVDWVRGTDRYETAWLLDGRFPAPHDSEFIASGVSFPDALAGAALAGAKGEHILLTQPGKLPKVVVWALENSLYDRLTIFGGTGAVSESVLQELVALD